MKKTLIFLSAFLLVNTAIASDNNSFNPGIYLGLQGGIAYDGLPNHNLKGVNFSGRFFAGYNFTKHLALESSFLATDSREIKNIVGDNLTDKVKLKQQILDFTPRINIPLDDNFTIYARGGIACIDYFEKGTVSKTFNITYGLGLDYKITNHLATGISWSHYNGGSTKPVDIIYRKYQPSLDFYGLSLTYNFS